MMVTLNHKGKAGQKGILDGFPACLVSWSLNYSYVDDIIGFPVIFLANKTALRGWFKASVIVHTQCGDAERVYV